MECMSTIRLRVSVRLAHRAQVLALSSLSAKSAFFFVSFTRRKRSFRPWNQRGRFHSPRPILAIEGAFPIPSQGPEPDILFRLIGLPVPVVAPAPLGGPDAGPAAG